jgi:hypothetical protein
MIGGAQKKILVTGVNSEFVLDEAYAKLTGMNKDPNWKLTREGDGLVKHSVDIKWLEFDSNDKCIAKHDNPKIEYSLMMSPFSKYFTWHTTQVTEIISQDGDTVEFKTLNSTYKLERI